MMARCAPACRLSARAGRREGWRSILHESRRSKAVGTSIDPPAAEESLEGRQDTGRWRRATPSIGSSAIASRVSDPGQSTRPAQLGDETPYPDDRRECLRSAHADVSRPYGMGFVPRRVTVPETSLKPAGDRPLVVWSTRPGPVSTQLYCHGPSGPESPAEAAALRQESRPFPRRPRQIEPEPALFHPATLPVSCRSGRQELRPGRSQTQSLRPS